MIKNAFLFIGALALVFAFACGKKGDDKGKGDKGKPAAGKTMTPEQATAEARKIFKQRCVTCHGETGKGDGTNAAQLKVKPRDYTNTEWQKSVTDQVIRDTIVKGGAAMGKDAGMTPNPDLGKPEKKLVLDELVKIVRSFEGK